MKIFKEFKENMKKHFIEIPDDNNKCLKWCSRKYKYMAAGLSSR